MSLYDVGAASQGEWGAAGETWTYAGADDPTYTFTIPGVDRTSRYTPGTRIKLTQTTGGTKYFIVTKVAFSTDTTVTLYGGTDYDLNNEAISSPYYSHHSGPEGFPLDPAKWTVTLSDTGDRVQSSPVQNTWYNLGSLSLSLPIGVWDVNFAALLACSRTSGSLNMEATLSTADNSESDPTMTMRASVDASANLQMFLSARRTLALSAKTTYYLNGRTTAASVTAIRFLGDTVDTTVRAVCAYLGGGGSAPAPETGWTAAGETWTYASGSGGGTATFTVAGDQTEKFSKGTRIKLTQTTVKYFVVVGSSHSAGTTTVTITAGSDYTLANAAITSPFYSYAANPQGYPGWFNYTPTWGGTSTPPALGDGTLTGVFAINGPTMHFQIFLTAGSTSTYGSGSIYSFTLPAPYAGMIEGVAWVYNTGVAEFIGISRGGNTSNDVIIQAQSNSSGPQYWGTSAPFTFGSGDEARIAGTARI